MTVFLACLLPLSLSLALRANDAPSKRYLVVPVLSGFCTFLVLTLIPASMNPCCWFIAGIGCYVVVLYHFRTFRSYKLLLRWYPKRVIFFTLLLFVLLFKIGDSMYTSMKKSGSRLYFFMGTKRRTYPSISGSGIWLRKFQPTGIHSSSF